MARLTKAEAARQLHISRTTLYKLIDQGTLSASPDGLIDTAELGRVLSTGTVHGERPLTPLDTSSLDTATQGSVHRERPALTSSAHEVWTSSERQLTSSYRDLVDILRDELQEARQAAQERERDYREQIARLTAMLDQAHQQNQRLLDIPRHTPTRPTRERPQQAPEAPQPPRRVQRPPRPPRPPQGHPGAPRGEMRRRIVALLQDHPGGLTPAEIRDRLGETRSLADTCLGMLRYGLVHRVRYGRYGAGPPPALPTHYTP